MENSPKTVRIKPLLGSTICWFLFNLAFLGLGFKDPRVTAKRSSTIAAKSTSASHDPNRAILLDFGIAIFQSIIKIYLGFLVGSQGILILVNVIRRPRKTWLWLGSSISVLALLFIFYLLEQHPNKTQSGDIASMVTAPVLVLLVIPGFVFLYFCLARRKSAFSLIWLACMSIGVVSYQWFFWSFTLSASHILTVISNYHGIRIILYVFCQLCFKLGPDTITIFDPTSTSTNLYLATSHGISSAASTEVPA